MNRLDAWLRERHGDREGAELLRRSVGWPDQADRVAHGIAGRLTSSYFQHFLTQNLVSPEMRVITLFSIGFLNNMFRSRVEFTKKTGLAAQKRLFWWGIGIALGFFAFQSPSNGLLCVVLAAASALYLQYGSGIIQRTLQRFSGFHSDPPATEPESSTADIKELADTLSAPGNAPIEIAADPEKYIAGDLTVPHQADPQTPHFEEYLEIALANHPLAEGAQAAARHDLAELLAYLNNERFRQLTARQAEEIVYALIKRVLTQL